MDQLTQFLTDPVNYIRNFSFENLRQILVPIFLAGGAYLWTTGTTINGRYVPWLSYMLIGLGIFAMATTPRRVRTTNNSTVQVADGGNPNPVNPSEGTVGSIFTSLVGQNEGTAKFMVFFVFLAALLAGRVGYAWSGMDLAVLLFGLVLMLAALGVAYMVWYGVTGSSTGGYAVSGVITPS